jgi:sterol 3beta-glucosyltransferase
VAALGVGPTPISQKTLTAEKLAAALRTMLTDTEMQRRAGELGQKIRAEKGVARAVEVIVRQL